MSYIITRTDGRYLLENGLPENTIDTNTVPVALIGKLIADYGTYQSNNFVHMLEHFANDEPPENPIEGMIWFNNRDNTAYICVEETTKEWRKFAFIQTVEPNNPDTGDLYYNPQTHQLFIYDEGLNKWVFIGPVDVGNIIEGSDSIVSDNNGVSILNIPLPADSTCNIEIRLVGREILDGSEVGLRQPECGTWNYKCCVSSYVYENGGITSSMYDLISKPLVETLGTTELADRWNIELDTSNVNESLQVKITAAGIKTTDGFGGSVNWKLYYKIIRVS